MQTPLLIGLHGVKRSGKNTTAGFIARWAGRQPVPLTTKERGFADKAKLAFARQFFPKITMEEAIAWVDEYKLDSHKRFVLEDRRHPSYHFVDIEFRQAMAQFATEGGRELYGLDHWVDLLLPTAMYFNGYDLPENPKWHDEFMVFPDWHHPDPVEQGRLFVADICMITDMRFENELERVKTLGGVNIKIRRKDAEQAVIDEAKERGRDIHASELGIPDEKFDAIINNDDNDLKYAESRTVQVMNDFLRDRISSALRPIVYV